MSNAEAIGAVTATLRNLVVKAFESSDDLSGTKVTTFPPDVARGKLNTPQLNLFLFQASLNGAWRNQPIPQQVKDGEIGFPPLPLNLHYLLTAWGPDNEDVVAHRILGMAMSVLHDHPLLGSEEIRNALPGNDLYLQIERVRITPQQLSIDELSKLWSSLATNYRVSVTYEADVVLIESRRAPTTPLPVLTRGPMDSGVPTHANLDPPFPTITDIEPPNRQPAARLGEQVAITGFNLDGTDISVLLSSPLLSSPRQVQPPDNDDPLRLVVTIPDDNDARANLVAGIYRVAVTVTRGTDQPRTTGEAPLVIAPAITAPDPLDFPVDLAGNSTVQLAVKPNIHPSQRASILLGDHEFLASAHDASTNTLTFAVTGVAPNQTFLARLRVAGTESIFIDRTVKPPAFVPSQRLTFTP